MSKWDNCDEIAAAFHKDPEPLISWAVGRLAALGGRREWDMEDNFETTEGFVRMASIAYGLPDAGSPSSLQFYGEAAIALGYETDIEEEEN